MEARHTCRPLAPGDAPQLRQLHSDLFPLNYEEGFFHSVVRGLDDIFSWAAVRWDGQGGEQVVGFITARLARLAEADALDRKLMDLTSPTLTGEHVVYLLTIGVLPILRSQGIASDLLQLVLYRAHELSCCAIYLHVVDYNTSAIEFYRRNYFWQASLLKAFYHINTGRQPDQGRTSYDALLFVRYVMDPPPASAMSTAVAQLRQLWACVPWAHRRRSNGQYLGNASRCVAVPNLVNMQHAEPSTVPLWLKQLFSGRS